jgi:predicted nucleic acid-binding protein
MDEGEAEAIALAMELGDVLLILDDKKARRVAQQIGLKVIGTVGMLLRAQRDGVIAEIKPLLTALVQADFRISDPIIQEALRLSGEQGR